MSDKQAEDKYYTDEKLAKKYIELTYNLAKKNNIIISTIVEPSAGNGSFYNNIENCIGYDIKPEKEGIIKQDFLLTDIKGNNILFIGNPPFGKNSSIAIKFFNHCAKNQNTSMIAFVLPKTFKKISIQEKLNHNFILLFEEDLPKNSFLLEGKEYDVPCVFQVWIRGKREIKKTPENIWFEITTREKADLALRRVGGRSGKVLEGLNYNENTTYFLKSIDPNLKEKLNYLNLEIVSNTAGVKSLSISELLFELERIDKNVI